MAYKLFSCEAWVTQYFGHTNFAKDNYASGYHEGLDVVPVDRKSWDLYAPCSGRVMFSGWGNTYGWNIMLWNEAQGMMYRFCHLEKRGLVREGDVEVGQRLGVVGDSGNCKGRHLHLNAVPMTRWGVRDFENNGTKGRVDPLGVLRALGVNI